MNIGFKTDKGVRRANNEDAFFVMKKDNVFIVADGVGGSKSGEIASRTAVNEFASYVEKNQLTELDTENEIRKFLDEAVKAANARVLDMSLNYIENKGMATTIVAAYIVKDLIYMVNVGDSRGYVYRNGSLNQITEDHTYVNQLLRAGHITKEEARHHDKSNMITRAVGAEKNIEVDIFVEKIQPGDIVLICTDGLYGEVEEEKIMKLIDETSSMSDLSAELVDAANLSGGGDNITVVCIEITEEDINE